jgi:glycosyltransferase involved in cell wall biosynthesis
MAKIHILTKNNEKTISKTLDSIANLKARIILGDLGSKDATLDICRDRGIAPRVLSRQSRADARNLLIDEAADGPHFYIEPWECLIQGYDKIFDAKKGHRSVRIIQNKIVSHETRLWSGDCSFINPVYERLNVENSPPAPVTLYSTGGISSEDALAGIELWKAEKPLAAAPYYYHSCHLFADAKYDDFLKMADHYLFMEKEEPLSKVMIRYYYAMAQMIHRRAFKPALQNINLCLCARPLMAEFWCLMGDVYYHLLHRFEQAREFYENAMILGARRVRTDTEPMDLDKYRAYPTKMIESCTGLIEHKSFYAQTSRR